MSRFNQSSWFPVAMFLKDPAAKAAAEGVLFGPAKQREVNNYIYPKEVIKKDETVIWNPNEHKTVSLKAYEAALKSEDVELIGKISKLGIPLGCTFGGCIDWKKPASWTP